ncbi:MAG: hypothetical protein EAZ90_15215 [Oscillatoriales cyanobacterium]|nr:MAG: hypothetical protein EAZ94_10400 [Oscillatoriales cyanobacterium]TAE22932.1 MAG: hypothetical protein EAZ93_16610 [Oscillatoriales cyanobacterium]TAE42365.1 MAG: hypothetical protein EAZ90_15215 [Oscillatoriales cyanobacterium]TAE53809.1 MAG: hypothetical protein EAZ88_10855 [Oscillatoriales cyanobacterium]TAE67038.1 MAG: hypothetical protein EAZ86_18395 [Oscillatoriales cyanobacterium]
MLRLRDFGVAAIAEANPGKLLRLWARSPVGLTATDDRSFFYGAPCDGYAPAYAYELFFL